MLMEIMTIGRTLNRRPDDAMAYSCRPSQRGPSTAVTSDSSAPRWAPAPPESSARYSTLEDLDPLRPKCDVQVRLQCASG